MGFMINSQEFIANYQRRRENLHQKLSLQSIHWISIGALNQKLSSLNIKCGNDIAHKNNLCNLMGKISIQI